MAPDDQSVLALLLVRYALTLVWTLFTGAGTGWAFLNLGDARRDRDNWQERNPGKTGLPLLLALGEIEDQRLIFFALLFDFLLGVSAAIGLVALPPNPRAPSAALSAAIASLTALFAIASAAALVWLSYRKRRRRHRLTRVRREPARA